MNIYALCSILVLCALYQGIDARGRKDRKPDCDDKTCTDPGCAAGLKEAKVFGECCPVCVPKTCPARLPSTRSDKCTACGDATPCTGTDENCCNGCCFPARSERPEKPDCDDKPCTNLGCVAGQREAKIFGECCPTVCVPEACPAKLPSTDKCETACGDDTPCTGTDENCCNGCCTPARAARPEKPDCDDKPCTKLGCVPGQREAKIFGECCPTVCVPEVCPDKLRSADKCKTACGDDNPCTGADENCCNGCCTPATRPEKPDCDDEPCTDLGCPPGQREAKIARECCPTVCVPEVCPDKLRSTDKCKTACGDDKPCTGADENCCNGCCTQAKAARPEKTNCDDEKCTDPGCGAGQIKAKPFGECCPVCVPNVCPARLPRKCKTACVDGACNDTDETCCNDCCIPAKRRPRGKKGGKGGGKKGGKRG